MTISPPSFNFKGDKNKAISFKAQARQFYNFVANQAELGGLPFLSRTVLLPDGTAITAMSKKENNYSNRTGFIIINTYPTPQEIKETSYYMESGFLDHVNTAIGNIDTYKPSIINFNTFTTDTSEKLINASYDRVVKHMDTSDAVGCSEKIGEVDVAGILDSYHFESDPPAFCDPVEIRDLKRTQILVPPSVYTGKLRLMVQGIYGSKRRDYTLDVLNGLYTSKISIGSYSLQHSGIGSVGIYKDPEENYWFIRMGASAISANKLLKEEYDLSPYINAEDEENKEYVDLAEAYILSTLTVDPNTITIEVPILSSALAGYPDTLAYGWKFNNKGDKASIVVYGSHSGIASKTSTGTSTFATGIKTKCITVSFGWDEDFKKPTVSSITTVASGTHLPFTQVKTIYPVVIAGAQMMQSLMVDYPSLGKFADLPPAPIYCFYDKDDELQIIKVSNGGYRSVPVSDTREYWFDYNRKIIDDIGRTLSGEYTPAHNEIAPCSVSINSKSYSGSPSYNGLIVSFEATKLYPDDTGWFESPEPFGYPNGSYRRYYHHPAQVPGFWTGNAYGLLREYTPILIIPFYDSEVALIGFDRRTDASSYLVLQADWASDSKEYEQQFWHWEDGPAPRWKYLSGYQYPLWYNPYDAWSATVTLSGSAADDVIQQHTPVAPVRHQGLDMHSRQGYRNLYDQELVLNPAYPRPTQPLTPLMEITATFPFFEQPLEVKSSYSGAIKWSLVGPISGSVNWPSPIFTTPVGWA